MPKTFAIKSPAPQGVGVDTLGHDFNDRIPVSHDARRGQLPLVLVDHDDIADMVIAHQLREWEHARVAPAGHHRPRADFPAAHVNLRLDW